MPAFFVRFAHLSRRWPRAAVLRCAALLIAPVLSLSLAPRGLPAAAQTPDVTSAGSGDWNTRSTWSCDCIPNSGHRVLVQAIHTVVVTGDAQARTVTVEGVLQASRAANSTLTMNGNLVVTGAGWLNYGTRASPVPAAVTARIRFVLDESRYVGGGDFHEPVETDVGLWVVMRGRVTTAGPFRGGWSPLVASAARGAQVIEADPIYASDWRLGDEVVIGPSRTYTNTATPMEDEVRRITALLGTGRFLLDRPLSFDHMVQTVTWQGHGAVEFNDRRDETLAPAVANLTRNVIFEAARVDHRPHFMFIHEARAELDDLAVVGFSPIPRNVGFFDNPNHPFLPRPFARYAVHFHRQRDAARGNRVRQVVIRDGMGKGLAVHDSYGVVVEDIVIYNQARALGTGDPGTQAIFLEPNRDSRGNRLPDTGPHDAWIDRPFVLRYGEGSSTQRVAGIWLESGVGAYVVGAHVAGSHGSGFFWCAGCGNPQSANPANPDRTPRVLRGVAHSVRSGFFWWTNTTPQQDVIDVLSWGNMEGLTLGSYQMDYHVFHGRAIGNSLFQLGHHALRGQFSEFLADGLQRGGAGVVIFPTQFHAMTDILYENGVVRGVGTAATFHPCLQQRRCGSATMRVQFARVNFEGNPLIRYIWHPQAATTLRFRAQRGLERQPSFTLYRRDQVIPGGVLDNQYEALRLDADATGQVPQPPYVRLASGGIYTGCAADEQLATGAVTLCAETLGTARNVAFYAGPRLIATVAPVSGLARATFDVSSWPYRRAYVYARATGWDGRINYSRVWRVRRF